MNNTAAIRFNAAFSTIFDYYTLGSFSALTPCQRLKSNRVLNVNLTVVLYYDYFLTLGAEVQYFWGRKFSLSTFLFFTPRYLILIGGIPMALKYFGHWTVHVSKQDACQSHSHFLPVLLVLPSGVCSK